MKKSARKSLVSGFTLIEFALIAAVLGIFLGLATPYLLGSKEKTILETEREKIVNNLKISQQEAIAAAKGWDYKIRFDPPQSYMINPERENRIFNLHPKVQIISVNPTEIIFTRLSGRPNSPLELTLSSDHFSCRILVSSSGVFTVTELQKI